MAQAGGRAIPVRLYLWLIIVAIVVVGVAIAAVRANPVQPLDRLPGGISSGPGIEEITATSAVIALKTGSPAFCQVNYGPTAQYGEMRRMTMSGPMTDHHILLPGLTPDTLYHFRLTAVDTAAHIYQSRDLTFQTHRATAGKPVGQNVASLAMGAKVIGVSSNYGGGSNDGTFGANHAIDGDPRSEWSSNGDGDKAWIAIELARAYHLTAIGFWTRTMGSSAQIQQFEVIADGNIRLGPFTLPSASAIHYFPIDVTAQRLRFNVLKSSGGNTGAVKIEAIAAP